MTAARKLELAGQAFMWVMGALIMAVLLFVGRDLYGRINKPPPFEFSAGIYRPTPPTVCPGGRLEWKSSVIVREAPTVLYSTQVLWSVQLGRAWKPGDRISTFVWTEGDVGKPISRLNTYTVPPDVPPGLYEVRVGASGMNTDADAYKVPFSVPDTCKGRVE